MLIKRLKNEAGYSLVEVMVAIMLLSIAIIPMVGMFDAGLRSASLGGNYDQARALANEKLEEAKALSFSGALARYPEDSTVDCNPSPAAGSPVTSCKVTTDYVHMPTTVVQSSSVEPTSMAQVTVKVGWSGGTYETKGVISK